ncbi:SCO family protein [Deinococcus arenicola]|uniref:SCO family protein n=1 Tax=Deinococcus arenicola TaxID=2994950 RepID=A0ABU4DQU9_9DEIO|nr:SCO family protein [Deinococcus sp. ZS9-10]MDV6374255.1 SCO family protein [Deinococcus sp. ZS9-10]
MTDLPATSEIQSSSARRPWYISALMAVVAVTLLLGAAWGFARLKSPFPFYGTAYNGNTVAAGFKGTDQDGQPYAFVPGQGGKVTALFFGFTHCPNICPLTLAYLDKVKAALPANERDRFQTVLVSVDPARDTPERLKEYVEYFGKAEGIHIPEPALAQVAKDYGVGYQRVEVKGADYQMNHTTATYLIDASGKLRVLWDYTQLPQVERVVADVQQVLETSQ